MIPLTDRVKQFTLANQNSSSSRSVYNDSILNENIMNYKTNENTLSKEEYDNICLTNKILNKSNLDLKNQINALEDEIQACKEINQKKNALSRIMDNMNKNISNYEGRVKDSTELIDSVKKLNSELTFENKRLNTQLKAIKDNYEFIEKTNYEFKQQIDGIDEIIIKSENEKCLLGAHLNENDIIISELN